MRKAWMALLCISTAPALAYGQEAAIPSFPIHVRQIVHALADFGAHVSAEQVTMLANVTASQSDAGLEVLAIEPQIVPAKAAESASWVKLGCRDHSVCLPFWVLAALPQADLAGTAKMLAVESQSKARSGVTMRSGTHATLRLERGQSHIDLAVVSLESGGVGRKIRVATPDYKQFYRAEVVSAGELKGTF